MANEISHCIGEFESDDLTCVGDPTSENEAEKKPCAWLKRCAAFTKYLEDNGKKQEDFFDIKRKVDDGNEYFFAVAKGGRARFEKFCELLIEAAKKKKQKKEEPEDEELEDDEEELEKEAEEETEPEKKAKKKKKNKKRKKRSDKIDGRKKGPTKYTKKCAAEALTSRAKKARGELLGMFAEFKAMFLEELSGTYKFVKPGKIAKPGQLFLINRVEVSDYISVYCKKMKGRDIPIARFRMKTYLSSFYVDLPVSVDDLKKNLSKATFSKLKIKEFNSGRFVSTISEVKKEELSILAESLAKLINNGKIELPSV